MLMFSPSRLRTASQTSQPDLQAKPQHSGATLEQIRAIRHFDQKTVRAFYNLLVSWET